MATIDITRPHTLGKEEAKKRADQVLERLKKDGIQGTWNGDVFNITKPATGTFTVSDTDVHVAVDLPFMLRPLKGTIEERINGELARSLV